MRLRNVFVDYCLQSVFSNNFGYRYGGVININSSHLLVYAVNYDGGVIYVVDV